MKLALLLIAATLGCGHHSDPDPAGQPPPRTASPPARPTAPADAGAAVTAHAAGVLVWIHGAKPLDEADALDLEDQVRTELAERMPQVAFDLRRTVSEGEVKGAAHALQLTVRDTTAPVAKGSAGAAALQKRELDVLWDRGEDKPFTLDYTPSDEAGTGSDKATDPLLLARIHANHALAHDLAARLPKL